MSKYTKQDIIAMVEEEDVEFIRLQFMDIFGNLKNMAVTISQLDKVLENQCSFDCGAIEGFEGEDRQELLLYPDLDTFEIFPWRPQQGKVARLICDVHKLDGTVFEGDSRAILKKVVNAAEEMGYQFDISPECEFFLFECDEDGLATTKAKDKGRYFDIGPVDTGENARREMVLTLEEMGFEVESSFHCDANGQHGINFRYGNPIQAADNLLTFKLVVRTVAKRHGLHATFMPKPKSGEKGSGMHINISMFKEGKDMFQNRSKEATEFVAGLIEHVSGMSLITNPIVNSYKRLVPGFDAPVAIGWSELNRNSLIRVPNHHFGCTKIELRNPDAASNPYLCLAVCLAAGLDGIKNQMVLPESLDEDRTRKAKKELDSKNYKMLPSNLYEAVCEFKKDSFIQNILGDHISRTLIDDKLTEWKNYSMQVSNWEVEQYLNRI